MITPDPLDHVWWLASRASGVVAMIAVSVSVIVGLLMANRLPRRPSAKKPLLAVHESTALAGLVAIAVHGATLLGDAFLHPSVLEITVPFTMRYRPGFTGIGVVAGWLAALLGLSFYVRRTIGTRLWRRLHRATIAVWALGAVHALGSGTDATQPWMRAILLVGGVPIVFLFLRRLVPGERRGTRLPHARVAGAAAAATQPDAA